MSRSAATTNAKGITTEQQATRNTANRSNERALVTRPSALARDRGPTGQEPMLVSGLIAYRELDEALGLTEMGEVFRDSRRGKAAGT